MYVFVILWILHNYIGPCYIGDGQIDQIKLDAGFIVFYGHMLIPRLQYTSGTPVRVSKTDEGIEGFRL